MTFKVGDYVTHEAEWIKEEGVIFQLKKATKNGFKVKMVCPLYSKNSLVKENFDIAPKDYNLFTTNLRKI